MPAKRKLVFKSARKTKPKHDILGKQHNVGKHGDIRVGRAVNKWTDPQRSFKFVITHYVGSILTQAAAADSTYAFFFKLSNLNNYTDYTAIYDQYRIVLIEITLFPKLNVDNGNAGSLPDYGRLFTAIDFDDATPVGVAALTEYGSCKVTNAMHQTSRKFIPHMAVAAYSGAFTSYANKFGQWIDCASPDVQHYGCKVAISGGNIGQTQLNTIYASVRYHLEFRTNR